MISEILDIILYMVLPVRFMKAFELLRGPVVFYLIPIGFVLFYYFLVIGGLRMRGPILWISTLRIWDLVVNLMNTTAPAYRNLPKSMFDPKKKCVYLVEYTQDNDPQEQDTLQMELIFGFILYGRNPIISRVPKLIVKPSLMKGIFFSSFNCTVGMIEEHNVYTLRSYIESGNDFIYSINPSGKTRKSAIQYHDFTSFAHSAGYTFYRIKIDSNLWRNGESTSYPIGLYNAIYNLFSFKSGGASYVESIINLFYRRKENRVTYEIVELERDESEENGFKEIEH